MDKIQFQISRNSPLHVCLFLACAFFVLPYPPQAQAVTCHCFKERSFKPSQPASADPYILATARNSLVAAAFGIEKGTVVRMRMKGTTETDLWLSNYLPTKYDIKYSELLSVRDSTTSWTAALETIELDTGRLGTAFNDARKTGDDDAMARALADLVMGKAFGAGELTLGRLRDQGANIAESALSLYLADRLKKAPDAIYKDVNRGKKTWGELLYLEDIKVDTVGDLIAERVRKVSK